MCFSSLNWVYIYKCIDSAQVSDYYSPDNENETQTATTSYYHGTIPIYNNPMKSSNKEMLGIEILCFLSSSFVNTVFNIIINTTVLIDS